MTRLILSLAIAAALAATACTGQVRAVNAAAPAHEATALQASTAEAPVSGLDLGMIDAGTPSAYVPINELAWGDARVTSGSGAGTGAYCTIDACITP